MADDEQQQPPENPFETSTPELESPAAYSNGNGNGNGMPEAEEELPKGAPDVAAKAGKTFIVLGAVIVAILFLLWNIFSAPKKEAPKTVKKEMSVAPKTEPPPIPVVDPVIPPPPDKINVPPPQMTPIALPQPVTVPDVPNLNPLKPKEDAAAKSQAQARIKSNMMIASGGGGEGALSGILGGSKPGADQVNDPNSKFLNSLEKTAADRVEAKTIGDMRRTIAQGRIIQATMESALNTDLPAPIRAIVSRDTYGEAGNVPLIPKGSRLIGTYNTTLTAGQTRVFVVWTRVIRPDGVDIMLNSPLTDAIGMAGVSGQLDSKFQEIFARSLVSSVMNIGLAIGADKINGGGSTTTTTSTTGTQTSGDTVTTATSNALNRLGSTTDSFIQRFINVPPTILVDQGTPVNVFVNKDLIFPGDTAGVHVIY